MPTTEIDTTVFEELKQMSGADFINELVDTFLDDAPKLLAELKGALQAKNADTFRRAAHSLKSNSATFGASHLSELAKELEMMGKENKLTDVEGRLTTFEEVYKKVAIELKGLAQ